MVTGRKKRRFKYLVYCILHYFCWYCQDLLFVAVAEREYWMVVVGCV
jgi:hypothetical protein